MASCNNNTSDKEAAAAPHEVKQYTIDQFYKNLLIYGGSISDDDKRMLVTSNETGIFNLYEIDLASGQRKPLTNSSKDAMFADSYLPGRADVIYNSDQGGNEISHLYLLRTTGTVKDLTPGGKEKANFAGWSRDNKSLYYISNKRDPKFFDLYKMDTATWTASMLYKNEKGFDVGTISVNERYFALAEKPDNLFQQSFPA